MRMFVAESITPRTEREGKRQWHCNDIGIPGMSVPQLACYQTSIWCHLIKTPVPGGDIQLMNQMKHLLILQQPDKTSLKKAKQKRTHAHY